MIQHVEKTRRKLQYRWWDGLGIISAKILYSQSRDAIAPIFFIVLAIQIFSALIAASSLLMLHADGAYFTYLINIDASWELKWRDAASRFSAYLFTVLPTEMIADSFSLEPLQITFVYGWVFYSLAAVQFALAAAIVWRGDRHLIFFPIMQYAFSTSFGFGFPSEILIAPGFCWIACFLVASRERIGLGFLIAWVCLLFSHEMAIPAALMIAFGALKKEWGIQSGRSLLLATVIFMVLVAYFFVRSQIGGSSLNWASIYVFDPRRTFRSVSMLIMITFLFVTIWGLHRSGHRHPGVFLSISLVTLGALSPLLLYFIWPTTNFELGRYESARSAVSFCMLFLTLCFFSLPTRMPAGSMSHVKPRPQIAPLAICISLAISLSTSALFVRDWSKALIGLREVISIAAPGAPPIFTSLEDAQSRMSHQEAVATERVGYHWALMFRSAVIANKHTPKYIVHDGGSFFFGCSQRGGQGLEGHAIDAKTAYEIQVYVCNHQVSPPSLSEMIRRKIETWFGHLL